MECTPNVRLETPKLKMCCLRLKRGLSEHWQTDDPVTFPPERNEFSEEWRQLGGKIAAGPNVWTDAYLAIFPSHTNATVITLDRKLPPLGKGAIQSLI